MENKVILFAEDRHGIYIPQYFAEALDREAVELSGMDSTSIDENLALCAAGPDCEAYWDAWHDLTMSLKVRLKTTGQIYDLYQDGDLWLIDETAVAGVDHELWENEDV